MQIVLLSALAGTVPAGAADTQSPTVQLTSGLLPPGPPNILTCKQANQKMLFLPLMRKEKEGGILIGVELVNCTGEKINLWPGSESLQLLLEEEIDGQWQVVKDLSHIFCCIQQNTFLRPFESWGMAGLDGYAGMGQSRYRFSLTVAPDAVWHSRETRSRRLDLKPIRGKAEPKACSAYESRNRLK